MVSGSSENPFGMETGTDVIYQAVFLDVEWGGRPDFLMKIEGGQGVG